MENKESNKRIRLILSPQTEEYTDTISCAELLELINVFTVTTQNVKYISVIYQKAFDSNECGIIIGTVTPLNNITTIMQNINNRLKTCKLVIFGICDMTSTRSKEFTKVNYITKQQCFIDKFENITWLHSPVSFCQVTPHISTNVHICINNYLKKLNKYRYFGIGGESYYYALNNNFEHVTCITNCEAVHENNKYNIPKSSKHELVLIDDYENDDLELKRYAGIEETVLVVNISKKGLRKLSAKIVNLNNIKHILYIGCDIRYIKKDMDVLLTRYKVVCNESIENISCLHLILPA